MATSVAYALDSNSILTGMAASSYAAGVVQQCRSTKLASTVAASSNAQQVQQIGFWLVQLHTRNV